MRVETTKIKYDVCIHIGANIEAADYFIIVKEELAKFGINAMAFTINPEHSTIFKNKGIEDYVIFPKYEGHVDIKHAADFAKSLGFSNIRLLYQTQKIFNKISEDYAQKLMAAKIFGMRYLFAVYSLTLVSHITHYTSRITYNSHQLTHSLLITHHS